MAGKRLVTEADVLALGPGAELVLDRHTIATPAALDAAHRRGIPVLRTNEPPPAAGSSTSFGADLGRMLASDGTYVVVVRAGRASITRITERGPEAL